MPNKKAIASLVLGVVGVFCIPVVVSVLALVFGIQARGEIDRSGGTYGGRGMAMAGIVLGIIGVVLGAISIVILVNNRTCASSVRS